MITEEQLAKMLHLAINDYLEQAEDSPDPPNREFALRYFAVWFVVHFRNYLPPLTWWEKLIQMFRKILKF